MSRDDQTIVYGMRCAWWDSIDKVGERRLPGSLHAIPCCPYCGSPLLEMPEPDWWAGVERRESKDNPGYRRFLEWSRGKCFPSIEKAREVYDLEPAPVVVNSAVFERERKALIDIVNMETQKIEALRIADQLADFIVKHAESEELLRSPSLMEQLKAELGAETTAEVFSKALQRARSAAGKAETP